MMIKHKIVITLLVFMLIALWSESVLSQEPKLIARWPLDENSGSVVGDVIGGNNGKLEGGPKWIGAKFGNGLQFDKKPGQYVEIPRAPELAPADSLTLSVWVNVNSTAGRQEIFCYADSYVIHIDGGFFKAYIHQGGAFPRTTWNTSVQVDKWYFLAMTYDSKDLKLYVDGKFDGSAKLPGGIDFIDLPLRFSNNPAAPAEAWGVSGTIDEVELWDKPMTAEEILKAYESPLDFLSVSPTGNLITVWGKLKSVK